MSLYAYNKTLAALPLPTVSPVVTLPIVTAAPSVGARGKAFDVTSELRPDLTVDPIKGVAGGLTAAQLAAIQLKVADGSVQLEWTGLPEYNTVTLVVGSAQTDVDDLNIALYVDAGAAGDDSNPGTLAQPVKTLGRALTMLPTEWRAAAMVLCKSGTYTMPSLVYLGKPVGPAASPLQILGDTPTNLFVATVSASDPARYSFTDGALALGVNALVGKYMVGLTGSNTGRWRLISENSATEIFTVNRWNTAIANGDTFQIADLNTTFQLTGASTISGNANVLGMRDVIFDMGGFTLTCQDIPTFVHPRCRMQNGRVTMLRSIDGPSSVSSSTALWPASVSPFNANNQQAGTFIELLSFFMVASNTLGGVTFVARNTPIQLQGSGMNVAGVQTHGSTSCFVQALSRYNTANSGSNKQIYDGYPGGDGLFTLDEGSIANFTNNGTFRDIIGPAITAFDYSLVQLGNIAGAASVTGTGVQLDFSSKLAFDLFGTTSVLAGALGDFTLKGVAGTYVAVRALVPKSLFDAFGNSAEVETF